MKTKYIYIISMVLFISLLTGACSVSSAVNQTSDSPQVAIDDIEKNDMEEIDGFFNQVLIDSFLGELDTQLLILPDATDASIVEGSLVYKSNYSLDEAHAFFQDAITALGVDEDKVALIDGEGSFQLTINNITGEKSVVLYSEKLDSSSVHVQLSIK